MRLSIELYTELSLSLYGALHRDLHEILYREALRSNALYSIMVEALTEAL